MSDFETQHPRHERGTPRGGKFAARTRGESEVSLEPAADRFEPGVREVLDLAREEAVAARDRNFTVYNRDLRACDAIPEADGRLVRETYFRPLVDAYWRQERGIDTREQTARLEQELNEFVERERRWQCDPAFTPPAGTVMYKPTSGPVVYRGQTGAAYTGYRDVTAVAKDVRRDLKEAVRAGFLPEGLTFGVRCDKYAGGQAMRVTIRGMRDEQVWQERHVDFRRVYTEPARLVRERVQAIADNYNRKDTSVETDYFNVMYHSFADIEPEPVAVPA